MNKPLNTPINSLHQRQGKDKHFKIQKKRVIAALYRQPKTMLMVSFETGILRANICRYVAELEKENRIRIARKGICPISKHRAGFYTTNPELFPAILEPSNTIKL
jgi:hypothetical protein